jgi:branched-chain amino acid transport system substrate-binding protein
MHLRNLIYILTLFALVVSPIMAADNDEPYVLNAVLSATGNGAFIGASASKTLKLIENWVNSTGGINGRKLSIAIADDQSNPQVAVQLVNDLVAKHVPIIIGPSNTTTCAAIMPLVERNGPISYCTSPYIEPIERGYVYSNGPSALDNARVVLRYYRDQGKRRVALINSNDASGIAADKAFVVALALPENQRLTLVSQQHFAPSDATIAAQVAQMRAAQPDVIISYTVGAGFATVVRGLHDGGLTVPFCGNAANMTLVQMNSLATMLPAEMDFAALPSWVHGVRVPIGMRRAQDLYYETFNKAGIQPDGGYGSVWDMTMFAIDALRHLPPNPDAERLHGYFTKTSGWVGANGIYDFRNGNQRGVGQDGYVMAQYSPRIGNFVPISGLGGKK